MQVNRNFQTELVLHALSMLIALTVCQMWVHFLLVSNDLYDKKHRERSRQLLFNFEEQLKNGLTEFLDKSSEHCTLKQFETYFNSYSHNARSKSKEFAGEPHFSLSLIKWFQKWQDLKNNLILGGTKLTKFLSYTWLFESLSWPLKVPISELPLCSISALCKYFAPSLALLVQLNEQIYNLI